MNQGSDLVLAICVVVAGVSLVWMIACVFRFQRQMRAYQRDLAARAWPLRIHKMLNRLGIGLPCYLRKASPIEVEKHLLVCEHCTTTHICDEYLKQGKTIDERSFCPNARELMGYRCPHR